MCAWLSLSAYQPCTGSGGWLLVSRATSAVHPSL
jgi:hypothetical protein